MADFKDGMMPMTLKRQIALMVPVSIVCLVVVVVLALFDHILFGTLSSPPGSAWIKGGIFLLVAFLIILFLPSRYKMLHMDYTISASVLIDATAERIWDLIYPAPGQDYYINSVTQVASVADAPDCYDLYFDNEPKDTGLPPLRLRIEDVDLFRYFRQIPLNPEALPQWSKDLVCCEFFMEREAEYWRVTHTQSLNKLRASTALSLLFLNPCRDGLTRLKALCEGEADMSWIGRVTRDLSSNGKPPEDIAHAVHVIGITTCVVLTAFTAGLVWVIASVAVP